MVKLDQQQFKVLRAYLDLILKELRLSNKSGVYSKNKETANAKPVIDQENYRNKRNQFLKNKISSNKIA